MNRKPLVTVYISSHNYDAYLTEAIESVLRQTFSDWELFLFNDGSTDETARIMSAYEKGSKITVFTTDDIGLPAVANLALKRARGKYIVRLDADDFFDENILLVLSNYLDRHPRVALVFPDYYVINDHGDLITQERRNSIAGNKHLLDIPAHGACTMIRKSILKKIGGYREDLRAQDGFDIWSKIIKGYPCGNVNLPLFYYRRHTDNLTNHVERILSARRTIKKDAVSEEMKKNRPIIAVIPCREHYDIKPDLWNVSLGENTLLDMIIQANLASPIFDKVVIISDTPKVKEVMRKFKDKRLVFLSRPRALTAPGVSIRDTLSIVQKNYDPEGNGLMTLSYIQAPFTSTRTLEEAVYTLLLNEADSSMAVEEIVTPLFRRSPSGFVEISPSARIRSDFDIFYSDARTALALRSQNIQSEDFTGKKVVHFTVPDKETFFISSQQDILVAAHLNSFHLTKSL